MVHYRNHRNKGNAKEYRIEHIRYCTWRSNDIVGTHLNASTEINFMSFLLLVVSQTWWLAADMVVAPWGYQYVFDHIFSLWDVQKELSGGKFHIEMTFKYLWSVWVKLPSFICYVQYRIIYPEKYYHHLKKRNLNGVYHQFTNLKF